MRAAATEPFHERVSRRTLLCALWPEQQYMANSIQKLVFKGLIGNMPWAKITVNEFINALEENGWREAHNGHIYQRLKERGPGSPTTVISMAR